MKKLFIKKQVTEMMDIIEITDIAMIAIDIPELELINSLQLKRNTL